MPAEFNGGVQRTSGLSVALDERDTTTHAHCSRVEGLSLELGRRCRLSDRELVLLRCAARLHDVGKIGIPDSVLKKPAALDEEEWAIMREHSIKSERIVLASGLEEAQVIATAVRHHHERFDGNCYPDRIAGEAIPVVSRIIAVADAYDAMASLRSYGAVLKHGRIMIELNRVAGSQHDPYMSSKFEELIDGSRFKAPND